MSSNVESIGSSTHSCKMLLKLSWLLLVVSVWTVSGESCSSIANEDKIDCVQHESWTPQSCLAKGCCHAEVPGFPACYYPFPNKHEARCALSVGERRDCGNADTTEIQCINKGCCWQMSPGAPFCYVAKEVVTDSPVVTTEKPTEKPTEEPTDEPTDEPTEPPTDSPVDNNPPECKTIKDDDKVDCAADDPNWTPKSCQAKGCCYIEVAGYPACFYTNKHQNGNCDVTTLQRTDCGDATTTEEECKRKGCCWDITPGAPACYNKRAFSSFLGVKDSD